METNEQNRRPPKTKTPLERIEEFLERQSRDTNEAELEARITRVRLALFGCAPK